MKIAFSVRRTVGVSHPDGASTVWAASNSRAHFYKRGVMVPVWLFPETLVVTLWTSRQFAVYRKPGGFRK